MRLYRVAAGCAVLALLPSQAFAQTVRSHELAPVQVDPKRVSTPVLAFAETADDRQGYDKYFYFVREGTTFSEAYRDIRECDALARGMSFYQSGPDVPAYTYATSMAAGVGGALGSAIGSAIVDGIFGSAVRRQMRRTNLRTCMGYKGYARHGLPKELWQKFNFEEGNREVPEEERQSFLQMQAKAAIAGKPQTQELEF